ncbi:hypothetical protein ACFY1L_10530 [Streptomyces sp. NPDC001663]|uniref:hypothetical protein n=1 Tax=Streptomyces sp. NPDC001663 TaxID=3364597 RepID=UPI0036937CD8
MKLKYTAAWVGFTAAAMVAASACSAEGAKTAAKAVDNADKIMAVLARATDRTEQLGSAEVKVSTDMGTGTPIAMNGTYSWGDGLAFDARMDTRAAQLQQLHASPTTRILFVDGAYYYDIDPQSSGPLKGKEWMKIDSSAIFGDKGSQAFSGSSGGNPAASMKSLKYANNVKDLGKETVDGQTTTHYRAVVDKAHMGKFKDAYGDKSNVMGSLTGGADSLTMDIWVGSKDLPVRLKQQIGAVKVTMDFEKFGATAPVKAPPAAQVGDLTEEIKKNQGQQG